jgi:hypothetical protein
MLVRTTRDNPFDWTVTYPPALTLPAAYPCSEARSLLACLAGIQPLADAVQEWAAVLASEVGGSTPASLIHPADWIHHRIHPVGRPIGDPLPLATYWRRRPAPAAASALQLAL